MPYPTLLNLNTPADYCTHFRHLYCRSGNVTHDNFTIAFRADIVDHCLYESSKRDKIKDRFSVPRANRLEWIQDALIDPQWPMHFGWDKVKRRIDYSRRVTIVGDEFVVVLRLAQRVARGGFVTCFVADRRTVQSIRSGPVWTKNNR